MGVFGPSRSHYPSGPLSGRQQPPPGNPNPHNYHLEKAHELGGYTVLLLCYPDCANYEGRKILVYNASLLDIVNLKAIDPHFCEDVLSPIARFAPTEQGWTHAIRFVEMLHAQPDRQ